MCSSTARSSPSTSDGGRADDGIPSRQVPAAASRASVLIEFARAYVDRLTVPVCSIAREPIPDALRYRWTCESFPDVTLVNHTDELPQAPEEHPQFWDIWRASIRVAS